jgi:polyisoprenyl-phosphate glycosyltransferase
MVKKNLSVIVPCFNEEENILEMYRRLSGVLKKTISNYEIIFVDNGSTDNSKKIFESLVKKDPHVAVLIYSRNFGPHGAYTGGLDYVRGDAVVFIDGDLQDPPELIEKMVQMWQKGYDVVYGIRKRRKGSNLRKLLTLIFYRVLNKLSYVRIPLDAGDYSLMDRKIVDLIKDMPEHNKYFTGLRAWVGFKQTGIEYNREERRAGNTKFSLIEYFRWALQSIFSFSYKPLEVISYLAILVFLLSFLGIFIYILDFFFYPNNPRGFITLILVILFLGGVQLLCLSIIGQYLANIFEEVKNRPKYIVKDSLGKTSLLKRDKRLVHD